MEITSPAFTNNARIPSRYTCQGEDISPPLRVEGVPDGARSLVLLVDDPDAPDPDAPKMVWDHWVVWNIPPETTLIDEGGLPAGSLEGRNSWRRNDYGGPCPPVGTHRYFFKLYALDTTLDLPASATKADVEAAIEASVLDQAQLIGLYSK